MVLMCNSYLYNEAYGLYIWMHLDACLVWNFEIEFDHCL